MQQKGVLNDLGPVLGQDWRTVTANARAQAGLSIEIHSRS
jgi:hypothetical protein